MRRAGLTFSLPQTVLSKLKPSFLSRIEPLQTAAYVCKVCLVFLPPAPWKEPGVGLPAGKHSLHRGASRARGHCGLVLWWLLQSPCTAQGGGLLFPLPRAKMRKSNFNPQYKAYKINHSAPPQIICRILNGILLTGNAHIQEKAAKWGCRTEGIASLAYQYCRAKINFKWIRQLKWGPGESTTERGMVSYTLFLLSIHPGPNLFLITLSGKGLSERAASVWTPASLSRLQLFPNFPWPCVSHWQQQTAKWLSLSASLEQGGGGCYHQEGQGIKTGLPRLLPTSQGQRSMERRGIALGRVAGSFTWW